MRLKIIRSIEILVKIWCLWQVNFQLYWLGNNIHILMLYKVKSFLRTTIFLFILIQAYNIWHIKFWYLNVIIIKNFIHKFWTDKTTPSGLVRVRDFVSFKLKWKITYIHFSYSSLQWYNNTCKAQDCSLQIVHYSWNFYF